MAEIFLIVLFALNSSFLAVVLMFIFLLFTILVHLLLCDAIAPLLVYLPRMLLIEESIQIMDNEEAERAKAVVAEEEALSAGGANSYNEAAQTFGEEG